MKQINGYLGILGRDLNKKEKIEGF